MYGYQPWFDMPSNKKSKRKKQINYIWKCMEKNTKSESEEIKARVRREKLGERERERDRKGIIIIIFKK